MEIYDELVNVLKKDSRFFSDNDEFLRNAVYEAAMKMDKELIKELLNNKHTKELLFTEIDGNYVFDKIKFGWIINNKSILPDNYTRYKNKIGLIDSNDTFISQSEDVQLSFPYKDCLLEFDSTKENDEREEIFYNELLAKNDIDYLLMPKVYNNAKLYDSNGCNNVGKFNIANNLLIKGNNLLAMYSLLPRYEERVKMMYWDILYNTESDKVPYADTFKHSSWLGMMKDRLKVAYRLLSKDGVLCMQCDDNEQAYLKVLTDEIFGRENFINCIALKMSEASGVKMNHAKKRFPKLKEYILLYKKEGFNGFEEIDKYRLDEWDTENNIFLENLSNSDRKKLIELLIKEENDINDLEEAIKILKPVKKVSLQNKINSLKINKNEVENWLFDNSYRIIKTAGSSSLAKLVKGFDSIPNQDISAGLSKSNQLFFYITDFNKETKQPRLQVIFADENIYRNPCDFWQDIKTTGAIANEGGVALPNGKKPEKVLYRLIKMLSKEGDIVLDAYFGTGTTGAVAMKMNRRFIGIEQLESHYLKSIERINNVINGDVTGISKDVNWKGGGSFVAVELAKQNENYVERILKADSDSDLNEIWKDMQYTGFISCKINPRDIDTDSKEFRELSIVNKKDFLIRILDKNQLYVNYSDIDDENIIISENDKSFTKSFYGVNK